MPTEGSQHEDLFAVTVTTIIGRKKFPQFARCFYDIGQVSVNLLDLRLEETVLD